MDDPLPLEGLKRRGVEFSGRGGTGQLNLTVRCRKLSAAERSRHQVCLTEL